MLGMAEGKVRRMGYKRATQQAYAIACKYGRPVLVPIPGTGRSKVVRPGGGRRTTLAVVPKKKALVLTAQQRGPMPEGSVATGHRGPVDNRTLRILAKKKAMVDAARNAADRTQDARAAKKASHHMSQKAVGRKAAKLGLPPQAKAALMQGKRMRRRSGAAGGKMSRSMRRQQSKMFRSDKNTWAGSFLSKFTG